MWNFFKTLISNPLLLSFSSFLTLTILLIPVVVYDWINGSDQQKNNDLEQPHAVNINPEAPVLSEDVTQSPGFFPVVDFDFTPYVGVALFLGTLLVCLYFCPKISDDVFSEVSSSTSTFVEEVLVQKTSDSFSEDSLEAAASFEGLPTQKLAECAIDKAPADLGVHSQQSLMEFATLVKYHISGFMSTLYEDPEDPLFFFKEIEGYFDVILSHYEIILASMRSKVSLLGEFPLDGSLANLGASLNLKFFQVTVLFVSYCQGLLFFHSKDTSFVEKITVFLNKFVNTNFLCVPLDSIDKILVNEGEFRGALQKAEVQEVLNSYLNLICSWGFDPSTHLKSLFNSTILTLHALNDIVLLFVAQLTDFYSQLSSVVPLVL